MFDAGRLTSDGGILLGAEIERRSSGIAERLARCLEDPRAPERTQHTLAEIIRFRALLIAAGYEDANYLLCLARRSGLQDGGRLVARERRRAGAPSRPRAGLRTCPGRSRRSA